MSTIDIKAAGARVDTDIMKQCMLLLREHMIPSDESFLDTLKRILAERKPLSVADPGASAEHLRAVNDALRTENSDLHHALETALASIRETVPDPIAERVDTICGIYAALLEEGGKYSSPRSTLDRILMEARHWRDAERAFGHIGLSMRHLTPFTKV